MLAIATRPPRVTEAEQEIAAEDGLLRHGDDPGQRRKLRGVKVLFHTQPISPLEQFG
jgi:hypothetical protein